MSRRLLAFTALAFSCVAAARAAEVAFKVADPRHGAVADAVVSLVPLDVPAKMAPPAQPVVIAQQKQEFVPYVTPVAIGTAVTFPNQEENVEHQVYSNSGAKKFEFPLYKPGKSDTVVFDRPGVVAIGCNIHDWMLAYVVAVETPWFAKTDAAGTAVIAQVPPGRYRAEVWQPRLAKVVTRVVTLAGTPSSLEFAVELGRDKRLPRPINPAGAGYK